MRAFARLLGLLLALVCAGPALEQPPEAQARIGMGAYIEGADTSPGRIDHYAHMVGRKPVIVNIYKDWGSSAFEQGQMSAIWRRGAVPMITWEPWGYPLRRIARGHYDHYVRASARAVARWGKPVLIRFAHEANGNWYPWGADTSAHAYKTAWRHVVSTFRREGAGNAQWVWAPYASSQYSFTGRFPGSRWVNWLGLDGFNWGGSRSWESFRRVFGRSYRVLRRLGPAPIMIAETGSGESGGSKASWLRQALERTLPNMPRVRALVWYSAHNSLGDYRVNSSRAALRVLRRALRQGRYELSRRALIQAGRHSRANGNVRTEVTGSLHELGRLVGWLYL